MISKQQTAAKTELIKFSPGSSWVASYCHLIDLSRQSSRLRSQTG